MKLQLWAVGKTSFDYLKEGIELYEKRMRRYLSFGINIIPDVKNAKNLSKDQLKIKEGEIILSKLKTTDFLILLDENGKQMESIPFARFVEKQLQHSQKNLIFLIGGAYGFSDAVYQRANSKISLSSMTFSHQIIRLIFMEQLYRAMTILKNEPYHHQ